MNTKETEEYKKEVQEALTLTRWTAQKIFWLYFVPVVIIIFMAIWGFRVISQPLHIIEKTLDADNVIYNYEWFHQAYQDIQATDKKIGNLEMTIMQFKTDMGTRTNWDFSDKEEYARLNSVLMGLKNYRQDLVAKYNARSRMVNRKIFKGKMAPEEVE